MAKLIQIIILGICFIYTNGFEIDDYSEDQSVKVGGPFTLNCHVSSGITEVGSLKDWKKCTWTRSFDNSSCVFTYVLQNDTSTWDVKSECTGTMNDAEFEGDDPSKRNRLCGMNFVASDEDDEGKWTCEIEQCKKGSVTKSGCREAEGNGNIVSKSMHVEVNITIAL